MAAMTSAAFSLQERAHACGIAPGEDTDRFVAAVRSVATVCGCDLDEASRPVLECAATDRLLGSGLNDLLALGLPIVTMLSELFEIHPTEVRDIAAEGRVRLHHLLTAIETATA